MSDETNPTPAQHDLGGASFPASLDMTPHVPSDFERNVDALVNLLARKDINLVCPDERRRGIESLPREWYFGMNYYQRWLVGVKNILIEKRLILEAELDARMNEIRERSGRD